VKGAGMENRIEAMVKLHVEKMDKEKYRAAVFFGKDKNHLESSGAIVLGDASMKLFIRALKLGAGRLSRIKYNDHGEADKDFIIEPLHVVIEEVTIAKKE
jgi:hypothetical protein